MEITLWLSFCSFSLSVIRRDLERIQSFGFIPLKNYLRVQNDIHRILGTLARQHFKREEKRETTNQKLVGKVHSFKAIFQKVYSSSLRTLESYFYIVSLNLCREPWLMG
jgi:hypothetical protein